jgi:hypothetical protein
MRSYRQLVATHDKRPVLVWLQIMLRCIAEPMR